MGTLGRWILVGAVVATLAVSSGIPSSARDRYDETECSPLATEPLPNVSENWWSKAQEHIRQMELNATFQRLDSLGKPLANPRWHLVNRESNLRAYLDENGVELQPRVPTGEDWTIRLSLEAPLPQKIEGQGKRIMADHGQIEEYLENRDDGIEHSFVVREGPSTPLRLTLAVEADGIEGASLAGGDGIVFASPAGDLLAYGGLEVYDALGKRLASHMTWDGDRIGLEVLETGVYPILIDPLATVPSWSVEGNQSNAQFGRSVSTAGDVDGDGYSDVIVGASGYDGGQPGEGRAFVFLGSSTGLSATASWTAEVDQVNAAFGLSVSTAGDCNDDGYDDIVVGAPNYDDTYVDSGAVGVYFGSATGPLPSPAGFFSGGQAGARLGWSVSSAGSWNGDPLDEFLVGAPRYDNGETDEGIAIIYSYFPGIGFFASILDEGDQISAEFGHSVSAAGDVNGDSYDDVIVGAPYFDNSLTDRGKAFVYHGSPTALPTGPDWTVEGDQAGAKLGYSVSSAGDVNCDGNSDVIVGAPAYDMGEGRAYVYHGSLVGLSLSPDWSASDSGQVAGFGASVSSAGDVNGDGIDDVIIGAPEYSAVNPQAGRAYLYRGTISGLATSPDWAEGISQAGAFFGWSVSTAGDVNGDGFADVIVGAPFYDAFLLPYEGRAWVYQGSSAGLSPSTTWFGERDQAGALFGYSVSQAGDVNNDGYDDIIVGAPFFDNAYVDQGAAFLFDGSATGPTLLPSLTMLGGQAGAHFGLSVSGAGDVNGDGFDDIIVGAPGWDGGLTDEGAALVFYGTSTFPTFSFWFPEGNQAYAEFGTSVSTAGDVNGDGYDDVIVGAPGFDNGQANEGRAFVYYGSATGLPGSANWTAESDQDWALFGESVSTAGKAGTYPGSLYDGVIVGAPRYDNGQVDEGRAYLYYGGPGGLFATAGWITESNQAGALYGRSVASAGDTNGNGLGDEIIVGAPWYSNGQAREGAVYYYLSTPALGLHTAPDWIFESDQAFAELGISVSSAGDVNGDGLADIIVGAHLYDGLQPDGGRAYVFHGHCNSVPSSSPDFIVDGSQLDGRLGRSVSAAGDVNGDTFGDVIIGAPFEDNPEIDEGRVHLFYGSW